MTKERVECSAIILSWLTRPQVVCNIMNPSLLMLVAVPISLQTSKIKGKILLGSCYSHPKVH